MAYKKKPVYEKGGSKKKKSVKKYPGGGPTGMYTGDYGMSKGKKKLGAGGTRRIGPMTEAEAMANSASLTQGLVPNTTNLTPADKKVMDTISGGMTPGTIGTVGKYIPKNLNFAAPVAPPAGAMYHGVQDIKRLGGTTCSAKSKRRVKTRRDFK